MITRDNPMGSRGPKACEIEQSQRALRESIEKTLELLDRSEHVLNRHRRERRRESEG
jgi:hypothetical protein